MPLILPGNVAAATAATGYDVANSCRFNLGDTAYMHKTPGGAGNRNTWTFSAWVKKASNGTNDDIFNVGSAGSNHDMIIFRDDNQIEVRSYTGSFAYRVATNAAYRDPAAWLHICVAFDSTQGTDTNRIKIYANGVLQSLLLTTYPAEDLDTNVNNTVIHTLGRGIESGSSATYRYFNGYMAEVCLIDGTAYAASDFGEFNSDSPTIWQPKDPSGLTFGTNGFYLDFEASGNLGYDVNGGTDLTEVNITASDQATDSPTNNFCTMNPLDDYFQSSDFAEGNCKITTDEGTYNTSTFALSSGKWYMECEMDYDGGVGDYWRIGIVDRPSTGVHFQFGGAPNSYAADQGSVIQSGTNSTFGSTFVDGDIISVALDLDNNTIAWAKNGAYGGGVGSNSWSGSLSATHSITAAASTLHGHYFIAGAANDETSGGYRMLYNFGGCSPFDVSSGNADENGYGNFEFAVPSGYLAICTKNLGSDGG